MRISDWSSDVCSSDLSWPRDWVCASAARLQPCRGRFPDHGRIDGLGALVDDGGLKAGDRVLVLGTGGVSIFALHIAKAMGAHVIATSSRSDEHTSELTSLMRISYAVFCLNTKN